MERFIQKHQLLLQQKDGYQHDHTLLNDIMDDMKKSMIIEQRQEYEHFIYICR